MPLIETLRSGFKTGRHELNLAFVVIGMIFVFQRPVFSDTVYNLIDYPSEQGGGTLTGSITVLDTAADDGVLDEAEIVSWDFLATNAALPLLSPIAGTSIAPRLGSKALASNVSIDNNAITIVGPGDGLDHHLSLIEFSGSDGDEGRLTWRRTAGPEDYFVHVTEHCVPIFDPTDPAAVCFADFHLRLWETSPASLGGDPWVIAMVPEPTLLIMFVQAALLAGLVWRRCHP